MHDGRDFHLKRKQPLCFFLITGGELCFVFVNYTLPASCFGLVRPRSISLRSGRIALFTFSIKLKLRHLRISFLVQKLRPKGFAERRAKNAALLHHKILRTAGLYSRRSRTIFFESPHIIYVVDFMCIINS